jgi:hypothetical protein
MRMSRSESKDRSVRSPLIIALYHPETSFIVPQTRETSIPPQSEKLLAPLCTFIVAFHRASFVHYSTISYNNRLLSPSKVPTSSGTSLTKILTRGILGANDFVDGHNNCLKFLLHLILEHVIKIRGTFKAAMKAVGSRVFLYYSQLLQVMKSNTRRGARIHTSVASKSPNACRNQFLQSLEL